MGYLTNLTKNQYISEKHNIFTGIKITLDVSILVVAPTANNSF